MNLKNLLLLIIRILIILLTILAIARPAIKAEFLKTGNKHPKTAVAIIIDNSYSMSYLIDTKTSLEKAKNQIKIINEIISEDDITLLLTLDSSWNNLNGNITYGKLSEKLIDNISITATTQKISDIIKLAENKLTKSHLPNREIIILSDLQQKDLPQKIETPTYYIPTHNKTDLNNISTQNSNFSYDLIDRKSENKLRFEVHNHTSQLQEDLICRLFIDNNTIAEKVIDLKPLQTKLESFSLDLPEAGWHHGFVQVINERLTYDNKNHFAFFHNPNPSLAIITDLQILPKPLEALAKIYSDNYKIINQINYDEIINFDAILCFKKETLSEKTKFVLDKIQKQKGIIFVTDKNLDTNWREYLQENFSLKFTNFHNDNKEKLLLSSVNKFHPITNSIDLQSGIRVNDVWGIEAKQNILLEAGAYPLIITNDKSILWNFDLSSMKNPMLFNSIFPILAYNSLNYSAARKSITNYTIDDRINLTNAITLPQGDIISAEFITFSEPGIYRTEDNFFAVNIDYEESNFNKLDYNGDIKILDTSNWSEKIISSRYGFEIWKHLLLIVLILFFIEMLIVKINEKKNS